MLLYGVTRKFLKKMDISSRRLETKKLVPMIMDYGGIAVPAHPFRESSFGGVLEAKREEIKKVTVIEEFNGVNAKEENKRASLLVSGNGLHGIGGSDAHFANRHWFLTCATKFKNPIKNNEDLVRELKNGAFRPISLDNSVLGEF
jgi:predicted metal-dependent phosphoesterase TrpH